MGSLTVRVEKATSRLLSGPDWAMNVDICDSINSDHRQAKDVVKAVKKRLRNKKPKVQLLALTLLEMMIKNCGDYMHFQVVERNILQEMTKIIRKKTDMHVRDKILGLLNSWQQAFGGPGGKYPQYFWAYDELRRSGVEFPQCSDDAAPIFTPPITHPVVRHSQAGYGMPSNMIRRLDEALASEVEHLSFSSLNSIRSAMELLSDMLHALNPNDRTATKDEVIVELVDQCRSNHKKLIQFLNSTVDEELLGQCLSLYDNLQSLLVKHDAIMSGSPLPSEVVNHSPKTNANASTPAAASNPVEEEEEEDDDFAQLARRHSKTMMVVTERTSTETNDLAISLNPVDVTSSSTTQATPTTFILSGPLTLSEPRNPKKATPNGQDIIDLLGSTLYVNHLHTPLTPPSEPGQTASHILVSPSTQGSPYVTQPYALNQGQVPYHTYVVPWAQPQPLPQQHHSQPISHNQPQPQVQPNPKPQNQLQLKPQAYPQCIDPSHPQPQPSHSSCSYLPPAPWEVTTNSDPVIPLSHANIAYAPAQAAVPWHRYHSFGSRGNNATPNANTGSRHAVAVKEFVPPNRLFEDLIDLRNADGGLKTGRGSSSLLRTSSADTSMMSGRK